MIKLDKIIQNNPVELQKFTKGIKQIENYVFKKIGTLVRTVYGVSAWGCSLALYQL